MKVHRAETAGVRERAGRGEKENPRLPPPASTGSELCSGKFSDGSLGTTGLKKS